MKPRPYQLEAYQQTKQAFIKGHKHICVCMSGGAGKSLLCKMIIDSALQKNSKVGFFSFRKSLTEQIKTYFNDVENVDIGTLQKYGKSETDTYDLVIFDEKDYHDTKLKNNIKCKYSVTLSGFPTDADGNILDYDFIVQAIQYPELVKQGYAKEVKVMSISKIDTSKLKKQAGDFNKGQSFDLMDKSEIKKDLVDTYNKYCIGRKTLLFAIDTKHTESLQEEFTMNGITCKTIHSKKDNEGIIEEFESGEFDLLINVAMVSIGVDIPCINTILFARPMCSVPLFMQCVWRGTRKFNDDYCLILDCAEVLKRTNFHPMQSIDFNKKKQDKKQKKCKCGESMMILDKKITPIDDYSYTQLIYYRCDFCNAMETMEEIKAINFSFCESCGVVLEGGDIKYKQSDNKIEFVSTCGKCGHEDTQREILLSDAQLKEIKYQETMKTSSWERVEIMLKEDCKKAGHNWKYSTHLIVAMKAKNKTPEEVENYILNIRENNQKISSLQFKG